ncbi:gluconate:H+ symporter [Caulobacter sp. S45]|uniref:GntT/GntP/DsdX family permease n=1 Tax=Caulobacter sp. S45 TaxID=1641861 RepID=UPI0015769A53|nr:gluconate:H+ symporter [Caulobacter sp. S45]
MSVSPAQISLLIGAVGVASLLVLILRFKLQPFLALLMVSLGVGAAAGIAPDKLPALIETGVGSTLGHVALIIALGAMIGRLVEVSGGADQLASELVRRFGASRAAVGLAVAGLLVGIPVFFEVGVVMLMPLAAGTARRTGRPLPGLALPLCIVLLVVHALLPPHPGAVAAASLLHVDLGRLILWAAPVVLVTAAFSAGLAMVLTRGMQPAQAPSPEHDEPGGDTAKPALGEPPSAATIVSLILLPIGLILVGSIATMMMPARGWVRPALALLGSPFVALLLDVLLCSWVLGVRRGWPLKAVGDVVGSALPAVAIVILITGAGGGFAKVLVASGVGGAVSDALVSTGLPILALAFLLALLLRVAQGPTAVAIIAAAGIVAPAVAQAHLGPDRAALVCVALGAGGMFGSHVNDAGFWIVTRLTGLDVAQGLRTWTVLSASAGVFAFGLAAMLWRFA